MHGDNPLQDNPSTDQLIKSLRSHNRKIKRRENREQKSFEKDLIKRWGDPLELLSILWMLCSELGEKHAHSGPKSSNPYVFDTLAHLLPRALLVSSEIMWLLKGGFADGALTRWRTLHELSVVAQFISKHGEKAAIPYRLSVWFSGARSANKYATYASRAGLKPLSEDEIQSAIDRRDEAQDHLGRRLKTDWDWASEILGKIRPTFFDIEEDIEMDHWRPYVDWSCAHNHAGFTHPSALLGMTEATNFSFQTGPSGSGLTDPIHMTSISLMNIATTFATYPDANFEENATLYALGVLVDEIGRTALISQANL